MITKEIENLIINDCNSGNYTQIYILYEYGISVKILNDICKKYNCSPNFKIAKSIRKCKRIKCNEEYFKDIDCEHKAFHLGFIIGDGSIQNVDGRLKLVIHMERVDGEEILANFIYYLESDHKFYREEAFDKRTKKIYYHSTLALYRPEICEDLIKLGVGPNKSKKLRLPDIPEQLIPAMIRGIFSSDGNFYISRSNIMYFKIRSSTSEVLEDIQEIITKKCNIEKVNIPFDSGCYSLEYKGNDEVRRIFNYMDENGKAKFWLTRKRIYALKHFDNLDQGIRSRYRNEAPVSQYNELENEICIQVQNDQRKKECNDLQDFKFQKLKELTSQYPNPTNFLQIAEYENKRKLIENTTYEEMTKYLELEKK